MTKIIFKSTLESCGLNNQAAADYLDVSLDTIRSWIKPKGNPVPSGVIKELSILHGRIEVAVDEALKLIEETSPSEIELYLARNDKEANERDWPCVAVQKMAYARIALEEPEIKIIIT